MVLIIAFEHPNVYKLIRWLGFYNQNYLQILPSDCIALSEICYEPENGLDFTIQITKKTGQQQTINYSQIDSVWIWHGEFNLSYSLDDDFSTNYPDVTDNLNNQKDRLSEFILRAFEQKNCIGSYYRQNVNKLVTLFIAQEVGFKIPATNVITNKYQLTKRLRGGNLITKNISETLPINKDGNNYLAYTEEIKAQDLNSLPQNFSPSLVQEKQEKLFEIRVFYLKGNCYAMAIFSQLNPKTAVDYRHYDKVTPNRCVPFQLPERENLLTVKLMTALDLNSGSLDIIYTKNGDYVFLEVNPVGQFGIVSHTCNYDLEEKIACALIVS